MLTLVFERDGGICQLCGTPTDILEHRGRHPSAPTVGHVIAVSMGGSDRLSNLQLEHYGCNSAAGA